MRSSELFRQNMRNLMRKRGLKVKELAEMAGLSPSYFSLILSGERENLSDTHKDALAMALDVTVCSLYMPLDEAPSREVVTAKAGRERFTIAQTGLEELERGRDSASFEDFLNALNLHDPDLLAAFYREINSLSDSEAKILGSVLRNTVSSWTVTRTARGERATGAPDEKQRWDWGCSFDGDGLTHSSRRVAGVLAAISPILSDVPLPYLEAATFLSPEDILSAVWALSVKGAAVLGGPDPAEPTVRYLGTIPRRVLGSWFPSESKREALRSLAQYLSESSSDVEPETVARLYLGGGEAAEGRVWFLKAAESAVGRQFWRLAKEHLRVVLSLDAILCLDSSERAVAYQMMTGVCANLGDLEEALLYQERNLGYWERVSGNEDLVMGLRMASRILARLGRTGDAENRLERALTLVGADAVTGISTTLDLAGLLGRAGMLSKARTKYEAALDRASRIKDGSLMAEASLGLGRTYLAAGDLSLSLSYLNRSLSLSQSKDAAVEMRTRLELAKAHFSEKAYGEAVRQLTIIKEDNKGRADQERLALADAWLVRCLLRNAERPGPADPGSNLKAARTAFDALRASPEHESRVISFLALAEAEAATGEAISANSHFKEAVRISRLSADPTLEGRACEAYGEYLETAGDDLSNVMFERARWARSRAE